jgi:hypothetical protein
MSILTKPEDAAFSCCVTSDEVTFFTLAPAVGADSAGLIRFLLMTIWVVGAAYFLSGYWWNKLLFPSCYMNKLDYYDCLVVSRICTFVTGCLVFLLRTSVASSSLSSDKTYYCCLLLPGSSKMISSSSRLSSIKSSTAMSSRKSYSSSWFYWCLFYCWL